jgi:hypothetical protein
MHLLSVSSPSDESVSSVLSHGAEAGSSRVPHFDWANREHGNQVGLKTSVLPNSICEREYCMTFLTVRGQYRPQCFMHPTNFVHMFSRWSRNELNSIWHSQVSQSVRKGSMYMALLLWRNAEGEIYALDVTSLADWWGKCMQELHCVARC